MRALVLSERISPLRRATEWAEEGSPNSNCKTLHRIGWEKGWFSLSLSMNRTCSDDDRREEEPVAAVEYMLVVIHQITA